MNLQNSEESIALLCPIHNELILSAIKVKGVLIQMSCLKCLTHQQISIEELLNNLKDLRKEKEKWLIEQQKQNVEKLQKLKKLFETGLKDLVGTIDIEIFSLQSAIQEKIQQLQTPLSQMGRSQIDKEFKDASQKNPQEFELHYTKVVKQFQLVIESIKVQINNINQQELIPQIKFELINKKKDISACFAVAMDQNCQILINGLQKDIQLWQFNEKGQINLKQTLSGHTEFIRCLCFSKNQQWFVSGSLDKTIKLWRKDNTDKWLSYLTLNAHKDWVTGIVLNNEENQIISSSDDKTIKTWNKQTEDKWEFGQTLTEHTNNIKFISLSPDGNILASCGVDKLRIWRKQQNVIWNQIQVIEHQIDDCYKRIQFINNYQFNCTTKKTGKLIQFTLSSKNSFQILSEQQLNDYQDQDTNYFPISYNNILQLIRLNQDYTYILQKSKDGNFTIDQEFKGNYRAGCISSNGEFLILYKFGQDQLEIWKRK